MRLTLTHPHLALHRARIRQAFCRLGGWSPALFPLPSSPLNRRAGRGLPR